MSKKLKFFRIGKIKLGAIDFKTSIDVATFWVLLFTLIAVIVYTSIAWFQTSIASDTARRQLRAYVGVGDPSFDGKFPNNIMIEVENGGQTPAYNLRTHLNRKWISANELLPNNFDYPDFGSPNDKGSISYLNPGQKRIFTFPMDHSELDKTRKGEIKLFIYGHVDYVDIYGVSRSSEFSYSYSGVNDDKGGVTHILTMQNNHNEAE